MVLNCAFNMLRFAKTTKIVLQMTEVCFLKVKRFHIFHHNALLGSSNNLCLSVNRNLQRVIKFSTTISNEGDGAIKQNDEETNSSPSTSDSKYSALTLDEESIAELTKGDAELEHRLRILILEVDVMAQEGILVPSRMKIDQWEELLQKKSYTGRKRYLEYLFKLEKKKEHRREKQIIRQLELAEPRPKKPDNALNYDLGYNHIFLRFYDSIMNHFDNHRLIQAMQFGQKLVFDCGFHDCMNKQENSNCAKQLMMAFADNRLHTDPFDLHLCNAAPEGLLMHYFEKHIPTAHDPWFPLSIHQESYLDIFPKEQLVYLTPHCRDVMNTYDHDAVYIIGAIVDKTFSEPLTLAKAKKEGIRMAKFPLDYYLEWGTGSGKTLTINHTTMILLDLKLSGDWQYALRHIPKRKLAHHQMAYAATKFVDNANSQQHIINLARKFREPKHFYAKNRNATRRPAGEIVNKAVNSYE